ncbi:glycoside hydrolase family 19 protein [Hydrogenophaga sp.]|uniref:glycoside hydrolase family 19 protein n=1 Tax=Hydrogenophaga sp. TaxID=1904254 RepID=UPI00272B6CDC|nr:glycoside hydrolase family 19 protein [Hydrogenophaga sp.]
MPNPNIPHLSSARQHERAGSLLVAAYRSGLTNHAELANFMGQTQHESLNFNRLEENLNYSGTRLYEVFPKRNGLTREQALIIANITDATERRQAVAEQVYGGTWGHNNLGNTEAGDGYAYRGRGYMQLTGRSNYAAYGKALGLDLVNQPELAAQEENAERIAVQYWKTSVQPEHGASTDVSKAGSIINTGAVGGNVKGLAERQTLAAAWQTALDKGYLQEALQRHPDPAATQEPAHSILPERPPQLSPRSQRLIRDSEQHVRETARHHHLPWDAGMDNTVHALACAARQQGLSGITHFHVEQGQMRFAQYDGICINEGELNAHVAANTPAQASLRQMGQADQQARNHHNAAEHRQMEERTLAM